MQSGNPARRRTAHPNPDRLQTREPHIPFGSACPLKDPSRGRRRCGRRLRPLAWSTSCRRQPTIARRAWTGARSRAPGQPARRRNDRADPASGQGGRRSRSIQLLDHAPRSPLGRTTCSRHPSYARALRRSRPGDRRRAWEISPRRRRRHPRAQDPPSASPYRAERSKTGAVARRAPSKFGLHRSTRRLHSSRARRRVRPLRSKPRDHSCGWVADHDHAHKDRPARHSVSNFYLRSLRSSLRYPVQRRRESDPAGTQRQSASPSVRVRWMVRPRR
jgi:hypothetical protein